MNKKVIIIGGGVAGLSAGIYSQINGFDTEIIEMNHLPGGQCTAWDRKGYRFDYCLHWLVGTAKGTYHQIWKETGVLSDTVKIINHEIHTKITNEQGEEFIIYSNIDRWKEYLIAMAPEDRVSIQKMCAEMKKVACLEPFDNPPGMRSIVERVRALIKMAPAIRLLIKYTNKTIKEYLTALNFKNQQLIRFLDSIYGYGDFSAVALLMMLAWFDQKNAGYLLGGSLPMTIRMTEKFKALGGKLTLVNKVEKIVVLNDIATGVILANGTQLNADYVISAADGYSTIFKMLGGKYQTEQIKEAYTSWPVFTPIVQVSFGVNKKIRNGLPNQSFLAPGTVIGNTKLATGYSLSNYSFDSTMAPLDKTVIVMRFESPWEKWEELSADEYHQIKQQIEKDALRLIKQHIPDIDQFIEVIDIATPRTNVRYTGVWKGAYEGFLPTHKIISKTIKMTLPKLHNFVMCGQWLFPGGGLPPSAQSGKWAVQLICKNEHKHFVNQ